MTKRKREKGLENVEKKVEKEIKEIVKMFEARKVYAGIIIVAAVFLAIGFLGSSITAACPGGSDLFLSAEAVQVKVIDFINDNLVQSGSFVTPASVEEVSGLYQINTSYNGQEIPVYATKDGKFLIVQGLGVLDMDMEISEPEPEEQSPATCEDMPKEESPVLEAFVVSYCPYGLQMQRILVEIEPVLGNNIKVRYIGSIVNGEVQAMHGETEATENLRQICLREEQPDKYWEYIRCFVKAGDAEGCLQSTGVNIAELDACMSTYERGVTYASVDFGLQTQYMVSGSPTLIMNGQMVSEFDFGGRTAEAVKTLLCCGFIQEPSVCSQELNTANAATGFSETYSGSSGSGSC